MRALILNATLDGPFGVRIVWPTCKSARKGNWEFCSGYLRSAEVVPCG